MIWYVQLMKNSTTGILNRAFHNALNRRTLSKLVNWPIEKRRCVPLAWSPAVGHFRGNTPANRIQGSKNSFCILLFASDDMSIKSCVCVRKICRTVWQTLMRCCILFSINYLRRESTSVTQLHAAAVSSEKNHL